MKTRVTVESLTEELDEARAVAARTAQPAAMTAATIAKGKLHGLIVDRKESGAPGDFASLQTREAVLAKAREELGEGASDALAAFLAASDAKPDALPEPTAPGGNA